LSGFRLKNFHFRKYQAAVQGSPHGIAALAAVLHEPTSGIFALLRIPRFNPFL
jgi:hypothetical protein